ncbi:nitroreductase family protein [Candidatus Woesearchaeota archaeon]|nr:nitroreductase family protein [Candidatus Woesearchaeota archaeon]
MELSQAINTLFSVRKFLDVPVEWDKIGKILDAGRHAPSSGNVQNWRFVIVRNPELREQLAVAALKQHWIANAPIIIVICAELDKITHYYGERGEKVYSIQNTSLAVQNMMLTAHALGLGSSFVSAFDENEVIRLLGIPGNARPYVIMPIGYSDDQPNPNLIHYELENMTYFEGYSTSKRVSSMDNTSWSWRYGDKARDAIVRAAGKAQSKIEKSAGEKSFQDFIAKIRKAFSRK